MPCRIDDRSSENFEPAVGTDQVLQLERIAAQDPAYTDRVLAKTWGHSERKSNDAA